MAGAEGAADSAGEDVTGEALGAAEVAGAAVALGTAATLEGATVARALVASAAAELELAVGLGLVALLPPRARMRAAAA